MKKLTCLLLCLAVLATTPGRAQSADKAAAPASSPKLPKFNLDFPGGTPLQLGAAIQKATGRPLNVIVSDEFASWKLPPLKMNSVDVVQVFRTMEMASQRQEVIPLSNGSYQTASTVYSLRSVENNPT